MYRRVPASLSLARGGRGQQAVGMTRPDPRGTEGSAPPTARGLGSERSFQLAVGAVFALAISVRAVWVVAVQHPGDAIFSDIFTYLDLARDALVSPGEPSPRAAFYPYGTHYVYAAQMFVFGERGFAAMAAVQVLMNAAVAPLTTLVARRATHSKVGALAAGAVIACWHPQWVFAGYFTSETPFMFFTSLSAWLWIRALESGRGGAATGSAAMAAFAVRPQALLTVALAGAWMTLRRRELPALDRRCALALCVPIAIVLAFSAARLHHHTGQLGWISQNGPLARLFASTDYRTVISEVGGEITGAFTPAAAPQVGNTRVFRFAGHMGDAAPLESERRRYLSDKDAAFRLFLIQRNVRLLAFDNELWPELERRREGIADGLRRRAPRLASWVLLPLAGAGALRLLVRRNVALEGLGLYLLTAGVAAAFYFGEIRYRVPYDGLLVVFALHAVLAACGDPATAAEPRQDRAGRWVGGVLVAGFALLMVVPWRSLSGVP